MLVGSAEVESVAVGGFQMPGDHFVGVERNARPTRFYPVGESLVEVGAVRLQQPAVGDVADQDMVETPDRLVTDVGPARLRELEPTQSVEGRLDLRRAPFGQRAHGAQREVGADHRGNLQHAPIRGVEPFQPGRQKRLDRGWDGDGVDVDGESPARRLRRRGPRRARAFRPAPGRTGGCLRSTRGGDRSSSSRQTGGAQHAGGELGGRAGVQAAQVDRLGYPSADGDEVGPHLAKLGPGQGHHEDRHTLHPLGEVLDEVEQQGVGPLDVVDDDDQRLVGCQHLDEPAQRPEGLLHRARDAGRQDP